MIYFMNFVNFDFIFKFFLFQRKKRYTLTLIITLNFSLLRHDICFQGFFFPFFFKADFHSTNVTCTNDAICWQTTFFNLHLISWSPNKLPNKFGLFINHKQPLKCVRQNSYLDLWSNTLYIIWQGVHLLVKLQARGTNK